MQTLDLRSLCAGVLALALAMSGEGARAVEPAAGLPVQAGLDHIGLRVVDVDRSIQFYTEYLGFKLVRRGDFTLAGQEVAAKDADLTAAFVKAPGGSSLELIQVRKPGAVALMGEAKASPAFHFGVYIKDVRDAYRRLTDAGLAFSGEPRLRAGSYTTWLKDPDGVTLELIEIPARDPGA